jgi:gamma-glutamylcyclotransferase (GGCT)/AIG2-like uncharacterized protein YtfP/predicted glutamine amidotransferase
MCLIIHKPNADTIIPQHILDNAESINPDGFGIVYTDTNECIRTMDYNHAHELVITKRPFVAHYRFATRGAVDKATCHPYHVQDLIRLFSNGTVADLGDKDTCDTAVVAGYLKAFKQDTWEPMLSMTDTRFAITYPDGSVSRYGKWHEKDGVFYSKNNCFHTRQSTIGYHYGKTYTPTYKTYEDYWDNDDYLYTEQYDMSDTSSVYDDQPIADLYDWQDVNLVAVYGTLKSGFSNHSVLGNSSLVGVGKTVSKYAMQKSGIPYVYEHEHRDQINVEVYEVHDDNVRVSLDHLESHPNFYERKLTDIELTDGSVRTCWLYFAQTKPYKNMEYIQTY